MSSLDTLHCAMFSPTVRWANLEVKLSVVYICFCLTASLFVSRMTTYCFLISEDITHGECPVHIYSIDILSRKLRLFFSYFQEAEGEVSCCCDTHNFRSCLHNPYYISPERGRSRGERWGHGRGGQGNTVIMYILLS